MVAMLDLILFLYKKELLMTKVMNLQYYHLILHQMGRSLCIKNIWNKKKQEEEKKKKNRKRKEKKKRRKEKVKSKRNHDNLLPTAKNKTGNLQSRVAGQLLYHDVFSTYMHHFIQADPHPLKDVI